MSDKNAPSEENNLGNKGLQSAKSEAGEQLLLLDCRAEAGIKGYFFFHRHRYGQFSKFQSGEMGPAPGRFELSKGIPE